MPFPSPPRALTGPRRRSLLASAAGAALLVGCAGGSGDPGGADPSAAERARARAARDSRGLRERYDAVIAAHPALAERLRPLRAEVARHERAFGGAGASPTASGAPAVPAGPERASASVPDAGASPSVSASAAVPPNEKDALAALAAAERSLADRRTTALLGVPGELARLLASVAAAGAAHAYLLTEGAK